MGAAKITATAKITTLLNMAPTPLIHLTSYVLALASRVNQPMADDLLPRQIGRN
jgi:hypothetical protein